MKKLLSLIVTLTMVIGVFCVPASAEEASISSDVPTYRPVDKLLTWRKSGIIEGG